jgi:hypothetical protein
MLLEMPKQGGDIFTPLKGVFLPCFAHCTIVVHGTLWGKMYLNL